MECGNLVSYLESLQSKTKCDVVDSTFHIVVGNETCDLDSAVSAVVYAYYLYMIGAKSLVIPLLNIKSDDYVLRTEVTYAFREVGILQEHLIFRDKINLQSLQESERLTMTLVDHNVLTESDSDLNKSVVEIVDHHVWAGSDKQGLVKTLEMVGSCATLVAEKLLNDKKFKMTKEVADLLHTTIIVDTLNLSEQAGRKTPKDEHIVAELEKFLPGADRKARFKELFRAKEDLSGLSNNQILRKDLKVIRGSKMSIAMSAVLMHMKELLKIPSFVESLQEFEQQQSVDAVVVMTLSVTANSEVLRQIAVFSSEKNLRDQISNVLVASDNPDLQLTPLSCETDSSITAFTQGNIPASRKKVLPLLQQFINT